jgi:hypothetical protein
VLCLLLFTSAAFGSTIIFGDAFGPTDTVVNVPEINPDHVDVLMEFSVDTMNDTMSLAITNASTLYQVRAAYFNTTDNITGLTLNQSLTPTASWNLWNSLSPDLNIEGYGKFDWRMTDGQIKDIQPGESFTWVFDVTHTGPLSDTDFIDSSNPWGSSGGGWIGAIHAVPVDPNNTVTGWAATHTTSVVPEPASFLLLGSGIIGIACRRRKM